MLSKEILAWAKNYFFDSMHIPTFKESLPEDEHVLLTYAQEFTVPVSVMLYGSKKDSIEQKEINRFLTVMKQVKLPNIIHYLSTLSSTTYFQYTGDITEDLNKAVNKLKTATSEFFIMAREADAPTVGYVDKSGILLGSFEQKGILILGETRRFPKGLNLQQLCSQDPTLLTDFCITVLRKVVAAGVIDESELAFTHYIIPEIDGTFQERIVTALTPRLPSYFVRKLISVLPDAQIKNSPSPYHAALEYAEAHPDECRSALRDLREIIKNASVPLASGLTDDMVIKYINDKYGIKEEDIKNYLLRPTPEMLYTSYYFLDKENRNKSVDEFMEDAAKNAPSATGTLDELLIAFCNAERFDMSLPVIELIKFINGESEDVEPDLQELINSYVEKTKISKETTLEEFIAGTKHKPVDDVTLTMDLINEMTWVGEKTRAGVLQAIEDGTPFPDFDLANILTNCKVPEEIKASILKSVESGQAYVNPEKEPEDIVTTLTRKGFARTDAMLIAEGKLPELKVNTEEEVVKFLKNFYPESYITDIMSGKGTPITEDKAKKFLESINGATAPINRLNDKGYAVSESLLFDMRNAISKNDTDELRTGLLPVIYSYMRVLMMKKGDESDVLNFLISKKSECSAEVAIFIDNAISKLEGPN